MDTVATLNQSQNIEIENLKHQLESMRAIMMNKDEEIMKLKNDLPIRPKSDAPVDRFENMFMTSLEVEAQKKKLGGFELQLKNEEIDRMKQEHEKELMAIEAERNMIEKELYETRHKLDEIQETCQDSSKDKVMDLEKELRDTKCSLEELQEQKDSQSLQMKDSNVLENMLRECEIKYLSTVEELRVAKEQIQQLVVYSEQMRTTNIQMQQMNINNSNTAESVTVEKVSALNQELAIAREQIVTLSSEQEDLLMMLADQEEKVQRFKSRLKDLGEIIVSDDENEVENGDDLT